MLPIMLKDRHYCMVKIFSQLAVFSIASICIDILLGLFIMLHN